MSVYVLDVSDFLLLDEVSTTNIHVFDVVDTLSMTDIGKTQFYYLSVSSFFNVGDSVTFNRSVFNLAVADMLHITDSASRAKFLAVLDALMMYDSARIVLQEMLFDFFDLSEEAVGFSAKPGRDTFELTDVATYTMIRNLTVIDSLGLYDRVTQYELDKYSISIPLVTLTGPNAPEC